MLVTPCMKQNPIPWNLSTKEIPNMKFLNASYDMDFSVDIMFSTIPESYM